MDKFTIDLNTSEALALFIFLSSQSERFPQNAEPFSDLVLALRTWLYDRLSIEDMEEPEALLSRLRDGISAGGKLDHV